MTLSTSTSLNVRPDNDDQVQHVADNTEYTDDRNHVTVDYQLHLQLTGCDVIVSAAVGVGGVSGVHMDRLQIKCEEDNS